MGRTILVILKEARMCMKCGQFIEAGQRAIKSTKVVSDSGQSYTTTGFRHEECWKSQQRGAK